MGDIMYKIIACDLDGTLLDDNKKISDNNYNAIQQAIKAGCKFVISSGRSNMSVDFFNKLFGFDSIENYAIAFNGAYIYRTDNDEVLCEHLVPSYEAIQAIRLCRNFDIDVLAYRDRILWYDKFTERVKSYAVRNMVEYKGVYNIEEIARKPVSKVIALGSPDELKRLERAVLSSELSRTMTTFFSADVLYEFNPLGIDKGTGLSELCRILGINIEETIAIGDNFNDLSMIQRAGLGVCCKNGEKNVKALSDYVTLNDNNNSAVAEVIERFVLI